MIIDMAYQAKRGVLPKAGGWLDQPYLAMQAIDYCQQLISREERGALGNFAGLCQALGV